MRWAVIEDRVTHANKGDVEDFFTLLKRKGEVGLQNNGQKRFLRLQERLEKKRVIKRLDDDALRNLARNLYQGMPWWRRTLLRLTYKVKRARDQFHLWRISRNIGKE